MNAILKSIIKSLKTSIESTLNIKLHTMPGGFYEHHKNYKYMWVARDIDPGPRYYWRKTNCQINIGDVLIENYSRPCYPHPTCYLQSPIKDPMNRTIVNVSDPNYLQKIKEAWTQ